MHRLQLTAVASLLSLFAVACGEPQSTIYRESDEAVTDTETGAQALSQGKLDLLLRVIVDRQVRPEQVTRAFPRQLVRLGSRPVDGREEVTVDVLIAGSPSAIPAIVRLGGKVRTVTTDGIMTANVPVSALNAVASRDDVERIEAARSVRKYNDLSQSLWTEPTGATGGMNNPRTKLGDGVIVGVLDTGCDFTHKDFIKDSTECPGCAPESRILYYWDQADYSDAKAPTDLGLAYGYEYAKSDFDLALQQHNADPDPTSPTWSPLSDPAYPIKPTAFDTDGHGTHVTGSAAGDGSGSGMMGGAPNADIIFVKFDFDGVRNSEASIVDGVNYIFSRAKALNRPAVINMSLGVDYGPHNGSTLEERSIDALTGRGKMVVVAASNPGANNWSSQLRWGYAMHGSGALNVDAITFRMPIYTAGTDNYFFFDGYYAAGNKCRVKVTTPSGKVYPPSTLQYKSTWVTGSNYTGFDTTEGALLVGNGGEQLGWGSNVADNEVYIEISDYYGKLPAAGNWTFTLVPADAKSVCSGTYHMWYGASNNVVAGWRAERQANPSIASTPRFGGRESDNKVTIGSPASANKVIAVAAYTTREEWDYSYGVQPDGQCVEDPGLLQSYGVAPIHYYDPVETGELVFFSARGPRRDGVLKPEIAAPGVGIASALSHFVLNAEWPQRCVNYWNGGPYHFGTNRVMPGLQATVIQGTSMASPNAAGAVAVLLQQKKDLDDACLRKIFETSARHDAATDTVESVPFTAKTDTDGTPGTSKPINNDWGYGKLDIAASLSALAAYPTCASTCTVNADCGTGYTCKPATHPCGCGTCVAGPVCSPAGASCTANSQCCSLSCSGKSGKKVCK
jgi:hypothetical protein